MTNQEKQRAPNGHGRRGVVMRTRVEHIFHALATIESADSYTGMSGPLAVAAFRRLQDKSAEVSLASSIIDGSDLVPETLKARARSIAHAIQITVGRCRTIDRRRHEPIETDSEGVTPGMRDFLKRSAQEAARIAAKRIHIIRGE
ncbi:hypothetical protein K2P56_02300 [Patescibacteria group bacterium]|nr:hypothetical protein [Patescibacteria group bacterium]